MRHYSIGEFAKIIGKSPKTIRNWENKGIIKPFIITPSGFRYYSQEQVGHFLGLRQTKNLNKKVIGYCRVDNGKEKTKLKEQISIIEKYMLSRNYVFEILTDISSKINYNNKGLKDLIDMITQNEVEKIVVLSQDSLINIGNDLIENLCNKYKITIQVLDSIELDTIS